MRYVIYEDGRGWKHRTLIRDNDPDTAAPQGIPADPPDISNIDWQRISKELHNPLVDRGLFTWEDVQRSGDALRGVINSVLKRELITLYRSNNNDN